MTLAKPNVLVVIDIECTCNDEPPLPREDVEIIEIGAVAVAIDSVNVITLETLQVYVKLTINPRLTDFCTRLTGIEQVTINKAAELEEGFIKLENWLHKVNPNGWGSWGKFDATQFHLEADRKLLFNPLSQFPHHNIKQIYARKRRHRVGLSKALQLSGLMFVGKHHSGIDDSKNIVRLIEHDRLLAQSVYAKIEG